MKGITGVPEFSEMLFPSAKMDPKKKDAEWHRKFAEGAYSYYHHNVGGLWGSNFTGTIDLYRKYGNGEQPIEIYKDMIIGKKKKGGTRDFTSPDTGKAKGMMSGLRRNYTNIKWEIYSMAPKFMRLIKAAFTDANHDVDCELFDENSVMERQMIKSRLLMKSFLKEHDRKMAAAGFNQVNTREYVPNDWEELEWLESIGAMKLAFEIAVEKMIDKSFILGKWDQDIKDNLIEDKINLNAMVVRDYFDQTTGAVVPRYVDPKYFVAEYKRRYGFKKSRWMGEVSLNSIQEVADSGEFTMEELQDIARQQCGKFGNINQQQFDNRLEEVSHEEVASNLWLYSMLVPVFEVEFKDINYEYKVKKSFDNGDSIYYQTNYGRVDKSDNKETKVKTFHVLRKCSYIIGTKYCYNWGLCENMKRPNKKDIQFSYHAIVSPGKSITAQCIPMYDELQLNYLSKQNAMSKAAPPGIAINTSAIANLSLSNKKMTPWDQVEYYMQSGNYFYSGEDMPGNVTKPFEQLQGGLGGQLQEFILDQQNTMANLREIYGITLPASASGQDKTFGLGVAKIQIETANDALFPVIEKYGFLKEDVAHGIFNHFLAIMKLKENRTKYGGKYPISVPDRIAFEYHGEDVGARIRMKLNVNGPRKERLLAAANESLKVGKNGQPGITQSEFGFIEEMIERGQVKQANQFLARCEAKRKEEASREAKENIALQNKGLLQNEQMKQQGKLAEIKIKEEEARKTITHKANEEIRKETAVSKLARIPEMEVEAGLEAGGANIDKR